MKGLLLEVLLSKRKGTGIWAALCVLFMWKVSDMERLDVSDYAMPAACSAGVVVASIVCAIIFGMFMRAWLHERAADNKVANGKIATTNDLPYNRTYDIGTVAGMMVGAAMGYILSPLLIELFLIGAGPAWYYVAAGAISAVGTVFWVMAFHCGLRLAIVRAKDYVFGIYDDLHDIKDEVESKEEDSGGKEQP